MSVDGHLSCFHLCLAFDTLLQLPPGTPVILGFKISAGQPRMQQKASKLAQAEGKHGAGAVLSYTTCQTPAQFWTCCLLLPCFPTNLKPAFLPVKDSLLIGETRSGKCTHPQGHTAEARASQTWVCQVPLVSSSLQPLWTTAHQAPLSMRFSRQECWNGLPCPPPGDLPDPGIEPETLTSPALAGGLFTTSTTWT